MGFFVSRHLRLPLLIFALDEIWKEFLLKYLFPLILITSTLFSQDILKLKSGKVYEGLYFGELDGKIIFKIKGESESKTFNSEEVLSVNKNQGSVNIKEKPRFEQDVLLHKSGKKYKGRYITKENDVIIFRLEGEKDIRRFLINDVDIIITNRGGKTVELYYPFDILIKQDYPIRGFGRSISYGFFDEKIPYSFSNLSFIYNIGSHSEFYGTLSFLMTGIAIGYKHYFKGLLANGTATFAGANISFGSFCVESEPPSWLSISLATGRRVVLRNKKSQFITLNNLESSVRLLNIGLMISYSRWINNYYYEGDKRIYQDRTIDFIPFISIETKL